MGEETKTELIPVKPCTKDEFVEYMKPLLDEWNADSDAELRYPSDWMAALVDHFHND